MRHMRASLLFFAKPGAAISTARDKAKREELGGSECATFGVLHKQSLVFHADTDTASTRAETLSRHSEQQLPERSDPSHSDAGSTPRLASPLREDQAPALNDRVEPTAGGETTGLQTRICPSSIPT